MIRQYLMKRFPSPSPKAEGVYQREEKLSSNEPEMGAQHVRKGINCTMISIIIAKEFILGRRSAMRSYRDVVTARD